MSRTFPTNINSSSPLLLWLSIHLVCFATSELNLLNKPFFFSKLYVFTLLVFDKIQEAVLVFTKFSLFGGVTELPGSNCYI